MLTIFMTIIIHTEFKVNQLKLTTLCNLKVSKKSRNRRCLVILKIFKLLGRGFTRSKFKNFIF